MKQMKHSPHRFPTSPHRLPVTTPQNRTVSNRGEREPEVDGELEKLYLGGMEAPEGYFMNITYNGVMPSGNEETFAPSSSLGTFIHHCN
jgi:hypothetical protein